MCGFRKWRRPDAGHNRYRQLHSYRHPYRYPYSHGHTDPVHDGETRRQLLDLSEIDTWQENLDLPTQYNTNDEAYQSALNNWWPRSEYDLFRNTHEGAQVIGFGHAYAEGLIDAGIIDEEVDISNGPLQDHQINGAWRYAEEELGWSPRDKVIADTGVAIGKELGAAAVEVVDLEDGWHGMSTIGRANLQNDLEANVDEKLDGVVWEGFKGYEGNDRNPMDAYTGDVVSGFNSTGMRCCLDDPYREAARNAVGTVDPNEAYTPVGYYSEVDVEGLERVGRAVLDLTGQNQMERELVNKVREIGNPTKEVLSQPENPNNRQEYFFRQAENEYERQDRYTIPHTNDLMIENLGDAFP